VLMAGTGAMVMEKALVAIVPLLSVTLTVVENVPTPRADGVPLKIPELDIESPLGQLPEILDQT